MAKMTRFTVSTATGTPVPFEWEPRTGFEGYLKAAEAALEEHEQCRHCGMGRLLPDFQGCDVCGAL